MRLPSIHRVLQLLMFGGMVAMTCAVAAQLWKTGHERTIAQNEREVAYQAQNLRSEVQRMVESLYSLATVTRPDMPDTAFLNASHTMLVRQRATRVLYWVSHVPGSDRSTFESAQRERFPDFVISAFRDTTLVPADAASIHYPVVEVHPKAGNQHLLGLDLATSPELVRAMARAIETGLPQTANGTLTPSSDEPIVFGLVPLFEGPSNTPGARAASHKGAVVGAFRIRDLFQQIGLDQDGRGTVYSLFDVTDDERPILASRFEPEDSHTTYTSRFDNSFGRTWSLRASRAGNQPASQLETMALLVIAGGFFLAVLTLRYLILLQHRQEEIRRVVASKTAELNQLNKELSDISRTDALTGIPNRRHFDEVLRSEWQRSARTGQRLALVLLDIDFFKNYNDHYGHTRGDQVLAATATALRACVRRSGDFLARYGGEEFAVILTHTTDPAGVARQCIRAVERLQIPHAFSDASDTVTISAGVADLPASGDDPTPLVDRADAALYQAKDRGRNQLVNYAVGPVGPAQVNQD